MPALPSFRVMPNPYGHFQDARNAAEDRANARADRDYRDTQRRAAQAYGQHVAAGQYDDAATVAGKMGDAEAATSARAMGQQEVWRAAHQFQGELEEIAGRASADPHDESWRREYGLWRQRALTLAERNGLLTEENRERFESEHPVMDAPDLRGLLPGLVERGRERLVELAGRNQTSSEWLEMQQRGRQFEAGDDTDFRPGTVWDRDRETGRRYVVQNPPAPRAGQEGPPAPPDGYRIVGSQ